MVGKPIPAFDLPAATAQTPGLSSADLQTGQPHLLNVFASWCVPCAAEAPQLAELQREGVPLVGVAIRDQADDLAAFLQQYGDPFSRVGADKVSQLQFLIGSSGVPETYVVDGHGVIRHQHIGDVRPEDMPDLLNRAEGRARMRWLAALVLAAAAPAVGPGHAAARALRLPAARRPGAGGQGARR